MHHYTDARKTFDAKVKKYEVVDEEDIELLGE